VAEVAAYNEYGTGTMPPRPFFRRMIAKENAHWGKDLARTLKAVHYNVPQAFAIMGAQIAGELRQSITDLRSPPLAQSTIDAKGFDKPLIGGKTDRSPGGHMLASVDFEVK
jgi:hypothetical protein